MQPSFSVSVHDIDAGGLARAFDIPIPWLERAFAETDIAAAEPAHAAVRLSRTGHDIIVRGKVKASLTIPCARCTNLTTYPVEGELALVLRPAKAEHPAPKHPPAKDAAAPKDAAKKPHAKDVSKANGAPRKGRPHDEDEYEFTSDEADVDTYDGETVILDGFLREAILLEAPSFPLCSEDCPGIRPKPLPERGEPVIDPRLSPLRALKTKLMLAGPPGSKSTSPAAPAAADEPRGAPAEAPKPAPERPSQASKAARPKIHAHRTRGSIGASGASKKAKTKQSPKKAK